MHTGITQASSSVELSGDVIANGSIANNSIANVSLFLALTSGGSSVDMNRTLIVYSSPRVSPKDLTNGSTASATNFLVKRIYNSATVVPDSLVEKGEMFEILIQVNAFDSVMPNQEFQIEIKPPQGATYTIHRKAPPTITSIMTLV